MTETESKIVTHDVVVPASPDTVQAIVSDLRTWPQYHPSAAHAEILGRDLSGLNVCRRGHALRRRTSLAAASASRAPTTPGATAPTVPCSPSPVMPEGAPSPADLDCFLGGFRRDLADLDLAAYEIYGYESQAWDINWKLVVEGTLEGYHFPFLHTKARTRCSKTRSSSTPSVLTCARSCRSARSTSSPRPSAASGGCFQSPT